MRLSSETTAGKDTVHPADAARRWSMFHFTLFSYCYFLLTVSYIVAPRPCIPIPGSRFSFSPSSHVPHRYPFAVRARELAFLFLGARSRDSELCLGNYSHAAISAVHVRRRGGQRGRDGHRSVRRDQGRSAPEDRVVAERSGPSMSDACRAATVTTTPTSS